MFVDKTAWNTANVQATSENIGVRSCEGDGGSDRVHVAVFPVTTATGPMDVVRESHALRMESSSGTSEAELILVHLEGTS